MEVKTASASKLILLEAAKNLFWKYGIKKVSVEEICQEAGISKMTFYRNFKNKKQVAGAVIENVQKHSYTRYRNIMESTLPFKQKVKELILLKQQDISGISQELIKDIYQNPGSGLAKQLEQFNQKVIKDVLSDFAQAQKKAEIRTDVKLEFLLYQLQDIRKKILDQELQKMYPNEEELIMALTHFFFYGIMPK